MKLRDDRNARHQSMVVAKISITLVHVILCDITELEKLQKGVMKIEYNNNDILHFFVKIKFTNL